MIKQSDWDIICTLYQCRSITKTSELLYITQPALTRRLRQLEEEFGVSIVLRNAKGVEFTPQGELFVQYAQEMKTKFSELTDIPVSYTHLNCPASLFQHINGTVR